MVLVSPNFPSARRPDDRPVPPSKPEWKAGWPIGAASGGAAVGWSADHEQPRPPRAPRALPRSPRLRPAPTDLPPVRHPLLPREGVHLPAAGWWQKGRGGTEQWRSVQQSGIEISLDPKLLY